MSIIHYLSFHCRLPRSSWTCPNCKRVSFTVIIPYIGHENKLGTIALYASERDHSVITSFKTWLYKSLFCYIYPFLLFTKQRKKARNTTKKREKKKEREAEARAEAELQMEYEEESEDLDTPEQRHHVNRKQSTKDMAPCRVILAEMEKHDDAWPFLVPVNAKQVSRNWQKTNRQICVCTDIQQTNK